MKFGKRVKTLHSFDQADQIAQQVFLQLENFRWGTGNVRKFPIKLNFGKFQKIPLNERKVRYM